MSIATELEILKSELAVGVQLVAVSKTKPASAIAEAYAAGQRVFGENRPQELQAKAKELPNDIEWHMIGHLQSNKVKYIAEYVSVIHSADKLSLLQEINKRAAQYNRKIDVLLQMHIAEEESKFGMKLEDVELLLDSPTTQDLKNIQIIGVMGMATFTEDENTVRKEFQQLKTIFDQIKSSYFSSDENFKEISMGMSGDYHIAMQEGSTLIRVGSKIFGARA